MDIPIYQRVATGGFHPLPKPQGVPALPKPPYELVDRSGERQFFKTIGGIGEDLFNKIIQAQAENEYHSFIGAASERQQQFVNLINQKPDMPLDEMRGEVGKMVTDIRLYHSKLKLPRSRQEGANWIASNLGTIKERAEGEVAVVSSKYAQETAALLSDDTIRRVEAGIISPKQGRETIADLYSRHILSGTVREEFGKAKAQVYIDKINEIEEKQIHSAILDMAFNTKNEDGETDIPSGDKIIENQPLLREEKTKLKDKLRTAVAQEEDSKNRAWLATKGDWDAQVDKFLSSHDYLGGLNFVEAADSGLRGEYSTKQLDWKKENIALFESASQKSASKSDNEALSKIDSAIYKMQTGAVTKTNALTILAENKDKITSQDFEDRIIKINAKFEKEQADAMQTVYQRATKQLVTIDELTWVQFAAIAKGKELKDASSKRQTEYWYLSKYDDEMNAWLKKNPEATRDEIYIEGRKKLAHYRRRTSEQVSDLMKISEAAAIVVGEPAIKIERRIRVSAPDGKLYTIPEGQKEEAIKQGYIIVE